MQIEIKNLTKTYAGGFKALDQVNLTITNGMFGLLGPNGAGKSTLMRILVTLLSPSEGEVLVDGREIGSYRKEMRKMYWHYCQIVIQLKESSQLLFPARKKVNNLSRGDDINSEGAMVQ